METLQLESGRGGGLQGLIVTKMLIPNVNKLLCNISESDPKHRDVIMTLVVKEKFSRYFIVQPPQQNSF